MAVLGRVGFVPRGAWDTNTAYTYLDVVTHSGNAYTALRDNSGVEPASEFDDAWSLLATKGTDGTPGTPGASVTAVTVNNDGTLTFTFSDSSTVTTDASVVVIDTIKVNGATQTITDQTVDITVPVAGTSSPAMDGSASAGSASTFSASDHVHPTDTSRAASDHTHGSITNAGAITAEAVSAASGDALVMVDSSDSGKVVKSGIAIGSDTTKYLRNDGSWAVPPDTTYTAATAFPLMDGSAAIGASVKYAKEDHVHPTDTSRAASDHVHGDITNGGAITSSGVALANGDALVFADSSSSGKLKQANVTFDGSTATKALTQKGTFETFLTEHQSLSAYAPLNSPAFTGTPTAPTATAGTNSTQLATTAFVNNAVSAVSGGMYFAGSLGTDGTITTLPAASSSNQGYTYKVITAGTYQGVAAKVGDLLVSDGTNWVLIPSGDEPSGTVTSVTLKAGTGISLDVDDTAITSSGTRTITNAGVRAVTTGSTNGTISVNTNGTSAEVSVAGLGTAAYTASSAYAASDHTHGDITNGGAITATAVTVGSGDALIVADSSASGKIVKSGIAIGSDTTKYLRNDGSWEVPPDTTYTAATASPEMDGTAAVGSSAKYAREDHVHPTDTGRAASDHTHGDITNAGAITASAVTAASGDALVLVDSSASGKIVKSGIAIGSDTTKYLRNDGSWAVPPDTTYTAATADPVMDGTAAVGSSAKYAREDHVHPTDTSRASSSHVHGSITNTGAITSGSTALASGDSLVFSDNSDASKLKKTNITFDGSTATKALTQKGTWETFLTSYTPTTTSATISTSDWSNGSATVNVTGVTSGNIVIVSPAPASFTDAASSQIYCSAQGSGTLTFTAGTTPTASITMNVMIM